MADERKRRRMESNRVSAKRSRIKKQQQLQQVISDIDHFRRQNSEIASKIDETHHRCCAVETEIDAVSAQRTDLEQRLSQLISMIDEAEKNSTRAADVGHLSVKLPPSWRLDGWTEFSKNRAELNNGGSGSWMEGLGSGLDFDLSLSPWRSPPLMASAATMSRT